MSKPKHTPGPWLLDGLEIVDQDKNPVCLMGYPATYPGDIATVFNEENVHLIAAAPELYGALVEINALDPEHLIDTCAQTAMRGLILRMGKIAREALAAARGETEKDTDR